MLTQQSGKFTKTLQEIADENYLLQDYCGRKCQIGHMLQR